MPSGMTGGRPDPASFGASFAARIGSFFTIGTIRPRSSSSSGFEKEPSGAVPSGKLRVVRSSFLSAVPRVRSTAATTTGCVAAATVVVDADCCIKL